MMRIAINHRILSFKMLFLHDSVFFTFLLYNINLLKSRIKTGGFILKRMLKRLIAILLAGILVISGDALVPGTGAPDGEVSAYTENGNFVLNMMVRTKR